MFTRSHPLLGLMILAAGLILPSDAARSSPRLAEDSPSAPQAPAGYMMLPEQQVSTPLPVADPDRYTPDAAFDSVHNRYLVVWHQTYPSGHDREIAGQLVKPDGTKYGPSKLFSSGDHDRIQPAVVYNATHQEFLVVFMYDVNGDGKKYDILAQRVNSEGDKVGTPFTVITWDNRTFWSPRVAWNSMWDEYMIIWSALRQDTQGANDVAMSVFNYQGNLEWSWIVSDTGFPTNPDITYDLWHDRYLVVWNYVNTSGKNVVVGDLRDSEGDHKQAVNIFASDTNDALYPRVTMSEGIFYLVTFEYVNSASDHDINIAWVNAEGNFILSTGLVTGTTNDTHPDVAGSLTRWEHVITYQRANPLGSKIMMLPLSNWLPIESLEVCSYAFTDCLLPSVTYGGGSFLNTYAIDLIPEMSGQSDITALDKVQHIFDRPFNTLAIFLPVISK